MGSVPFDVKADELYNASGEAIDVAPSPMMQIQIPFERPVKAGAVLRMKADDN